MFNSFIIIIFLTRKKSLTFEVKLSITALEMYLLWLGIWIGILFFPLQSRAQHSFLRLKDISYQLNGTSSHRLVMGFAAYHK